MRVVAVVAVAVALVPAAGCDRSPRGTSTPPTTGAPGRLAANAEMMDVVDGDTIDVSVGGTRERVRLIGIDTPETKKPDTPAQCYGPEATARTKELLPVGTDLYIERDLEARDPYGRLLGYVYRSDDGLFVNLDLVRQGYARTLTIEPNVGHADDFATASAAASNDHLGLWAECTG